MSIPHSETRFWPRFRACAPSRSRCPGNVDRADDLVQETILRALANIHSFQPGTNLPAWLFTILRNLFRSEYRKRRREVEDADGSFAQTLKSQSRSDRPHRVPGIPRGARAIAAGPARSADPGRRVRLLLRGSRRYLRMRGRHHQEPRQPRALAARQAARGRQCRRDRSRSTRCAACWRGTKPDPRSQRRTQKKTPCPKARRFLFRPMRVTARSACVRGRGRSRPRSRTTPGRRQKRSSRFDGERGNAAEAENGGDQRDRQKCHGPAKHERFSLHVRTHASIAGRSATATKVPLEPRAAQAVEPAELAGAIDNEENRTEARTRTIKAGSRAPPARSRISPASLSPS